MGEVLDYLAGPGFGQLMAAKAPGASPLDEDFSSAQEYRQRYLLAALLRGER